jgi:hypothetical protein
MSGDRSSVAGIRATVAATAKDFVVQCMWQKTKNFLANIKTLILDAVRWIDLLFDGNWVSVARNIGGVFIGFTGESGFDFEKLV